MSGYRGKRSLDIIVSSLALFCSIPVLIVIALLICVNLGKPIIFRQKRPGLHGKPFTIYKFRTMSNIKDISGKFLPDSHRMTRFGHYLRRTSLDELPELVNVLKGEMSLVGPRPLLMQYLSLYTFEQARRHDIKPGITGWAQVNGRNNLSWEDKFKLDVWYVEHCTLLLDLWILVITILKVVARQGINQPGETTVSEFAEINPMSQDKDQ